MNIELTGVVGWLFVICVGVTGSVIIILGTSYLWEKLLWDVLMKRLMGYRLYRMFIVFMYRRNEFAEWLKENHPKEDEIVNNKNKTNGTKQSS